MKDQDKDKDKRLGGSWLLVDLHGGYELFTKQALVRPCRPFEAPKGLTPGIIQFGLSRHCG
jgi:hypothetical protein